MFESCVTQLTLTRGFTSLWHTILHKIYMCATAVQREENIPQKCMLHFKMSSLKFMQSYKNDDFIIHHQCQWIMFDKVLVVSSPYCLWVMLGAVTPVKLCPTPPGSSSSHTPIVFKHNVLCPVWQPWRDLFSTVGKDVGNDGFALSDPAVVSAYRPVFSK